MIAIPVILPIFLLLNPKNITNIPVELNFNGDNAYIYVQEQLEINTTHYRIPGTQGREDCALYFKERILNISSSFSATFHNFTINSFSCQNVLLKLNEHHENIVILGAHYDSRARATKDPNVLNRDDPVPGANDGASGSAVLVELAEVLFANRNLLDCQLWFLFFDAEDQGHDYAYGIDGWDWIMGSTRFVQNIQDFYNPVTERIDCMILLDMVGGHNLKFINEQHSTYSLLSEIFEIGRQLGYSEQFASGATTASITDDHVPFVQSGIPSADIIINFWSKPDWPYHHTIDDDLAHISNSSLEITGRVVEQFIYNNYLNIPENNYVGNFFSQELGRD